MGYVTNVVLISASGDRDAARQVSDWLENHDQPRLLQVDDTWDRVRGREKNTSVEIRIGALNYVDRVALIEAFRASSWERPERARLILDAFEYFSVTSAGDGAVEGEVT